jgi:glycosyltransferase 2 family protein
MRFGWRGALGIVLSALLLWFAFRDVPWSEVAVETQRAHWGLLLLSALAATCIFPLRARRWRTILDPVERGLPFGALWRSTAIGMMVSNIIPARAGELARAYALSRAVPRVSFSAAFASIAVDRVFDTVVVLLLMFVAVLSPGFPGDSGTLVRRSATLGVVAILVVLVVLYCIVFFPAQIISLFELFARRVAPRFEERGKAILTSFASGLSVLRSPARFVAVFWWALLHWLLNAFAFWIGFKAVGIQAPFSASLFVQAIIAIGVALPSSPGFFGPFELAGKVALGVYGVSQSLAVTWAVGFHVVSYIPITVIGGYYFARLGLSMDEIRHAGETGNGDANRAPDGSPPARRAGSAESTRAAPRSAQPPAP